MPRGRHDRRPAAVRQRPSHDEQDSRPGHHDEHQRRDREAKQLPGIDHGVHPLSSPSGRASSPGTRPTMVVPGPRSRRAVMSVNETAITTATPAGATRPAFHLAIPVDDLARAEAFYGGILGLPRGRSSASWTDWNLAGHQVVTHLVEGQRAARASNPVDGHDVPVPHFGLVLSVPAFHDFADRLRAAATTFVIEP